MKPEEDMERPSQLTILLESAAMVSASASQWPLQASAVFSDCRRYRYALWRCWGPGTHVLFVLLNPSTADAEADDPTVRKCAAFAKAWGCHAMAIANLFALRATDPREMLAHPSPVGPENMSWVSRLARHADLVVAGWGRHGHHWQQDETTLQVLRVVLESRGKALQCLRRNGNGTPAHPLYLPGTLRPVPLDGGAK